MGGVISRGIKDDFPNVCFTLRERNNHSRICRFSLTVPRVFVYNSPIKQADICDHPRPLGAGKIFDNLAVGNQPSAFSRRLKPAPI
jgi:hypothetical protein